MDEDNPSLALVQMWVDRSDPVNYAPLMVRERPIVDGVQVPRVFVSARTGAGLPQLRTALAEAAARQARPGLIQDIPTDRTPA